MWKHHFPPYKKFEQSLDWRPATCIVTVHDRKLDKVAAVFSPQSFYQVKNTNVGPVH